MESLRAIPWVFAWTQTRLLLPSWLGVGEALDEAIEAGAVDELQAMYRDWPFFRSTLDLIEMVLAKTDCRVAEHYDQQLVPADLRPLGAKLRTRLADTVAHVLAVTGRQGLLADNQVLRRSIDVRNPYVDPINLVQVELLRRLRRKGTSDERLRHAFLITVNEHRRGDAEHGIARHDGSRPGAEQQSLTAHGLFFHIAAGPATVSPVLIRLLAPLLAVLVLPGSVAAQDDWMRPPQNPFTVPLWPDGVPGALGGEDADKPSLTIHLPTPRKPRAPGLWSAPGAATAVSHSTTRDIRWRGC